MTRNRLKLEIEESYVVQPGMIEMLSYGYAEILNKTNIIYLISRDTYWLIKLLYFRV